MPLGDDETELVVVLHLIGAEQHGGGAGGALLLGRGYRQRHGQQRAKAQSGGAAHSRQPSSRCSSMLAPRSQLTPAGVQAANATGIVAERPNAKTMSDMK